MLPTLPQNASVPPFQCEHLSHMKANIPPGGLSLTRQKRKNS